MALVSVLSAIMVLGMVFIGLSQTAHDLARTRLETAIPAYAAKVEKTVAELQGETPAESVSNLYYVTDYFNPGAMPNIISEENQNQVDLDAIMSNRRFRKVFSELGKMDKAAASQMVKTNLISALANYSNLYEKIMPQLDPLFKITKDHTNSGPISFTVGVTKPEDEGAETITGERMKVFSLVWISGMLRLTDNRELIEQVTRLALKQRMELNFDPTWQPDFKATMSQCVSLYNRQILSSGLLGVTFKDEGMESNVMTAAGIQWQQKKLVAYDAALTEFDKPAAVMAPDRSTGTLTVSFVSPMHDTNFDLLLQAIHFK